MSCHSSSDVKSQFSEVYYCYAINADLSHIYELYLAHFGFI